MFLLAASSFSFSQIAFMLDTEVILEPQHKIAYM